MQIIERMPDDEYDAVCAAGAELVKELVKLLERSGFGMDQAPAILAVASAGITKGFDIETDDFASLVSSAKMMWRVDQREGGSGIIFDPPHHRPDYAPVARDASKEN